MRLLAFSLALAVNGQGLYCGLTPLRPLNTPANSVPVCTCTGQSCFYVWQAPATPLMNSTIPLYSQPPAAIDVLGAATRALQLRQLQLENDILRQQATASAPAVVLPSNPNPAFFGVSARDANDQDRGKYGIAMGGAVVLTVQNPSPASVAGVKTGDFIVKFDGEYVASEIHLIQLIRSRRPGQKIQVELGRDGSRVSLTVFLSERL